MLVKKVEIVNQKSTSILRKFLIGIIVLMLLAGGGIWYLFNIKFSDTKAIQADHIVNAIDLIHEFEKNNSLSNKKYAEKIMVVNGIVSEVEVADTTVNIKMADTTSGSYIIFAFQEQSLAEAKSMKEGDPVSIKGSCSGGAYSEILETEFITFKRCTINQEK